MKEKISAYIDGEGNKEELEKLLKEDPELKEYFEQLSFMKSALSEMNVQSPDVLNKVIERERKHRIVFRYRFAFASIFAVTIISILFFRFYNFKPQEKGITTPSLRSGEEQPYFSMTVSKPEVNVSIDVRDDETLLTILEKHGTITGSNAEGKGDGGEFQPKENMPQKVLYYKIVGSDITKLVEDIEKINGATVMLPESLPYFSQDNTEIDIVINIYEK
jgi:hypothetical protein